MEKVLHLHIDRHKYKHRSTNPFLVQKPSRYLVQKPLTLNVPDDLINDWCLSLILLKDGLIDRLIITDDEFSLQIQKQDQDNGSNEVYEIENGWQIDISQSELGYWLSFYLQYYRDGIGRVDHIDANNLASGPSLDYDFSLVLKVPKAVPPIPVEQWRDEQLSAATVRFGELFAQFSGIKFLRAEIVIDPMVELVKAGQILLSKHTSEAAPSTVIAWVKEIMKQEKIEGEYLLRFNDPQVEPFLWGAWARVVIDSTYDWVEAIWSLGEHLSFMKVDFSALVDITSLPSIDEYRFQAFKSRLPT